MLAHELRNPLAAIANALAVLQKLPQVPAAGVDTCQIAEEQLRHLRKLIDDLLDVSRITHGKITLKTATVKLSAIVAHALETMKPFLACVRSSWSWTWPLAPLWVDANFYRFAQVIGNILHNAGSTPRRMGA